MARRALITDSMGDYSVHGDDNLTEAERSMQELIASIPCGTYYHARMVRVLAQAIVDTRRAARSEIIGELRHGHEYDNDFPDGAVDAADWLEKH